jgi:hypothetical protein
MKILFYYAGAPSPILETMLELINIHVKKKDVITVYECDANLHNCFWNPEKKYLKCIECKSKINNSHQVFNSNKIFFRSFNNIEISNKQIPQIFLDLNELKNYSYDGVKIGISVASRLTSLYRDHCFDTLLNNTQIQIEIKTAIQVYENLKSEIINNRPDIVYIFNGRITTDYPVVELCKKFGVNFYTYEISYSPNKYSLRFNSTAHSIDAMSKEIESLWNSGPSNKFEIAKNWFQNKKNGKDIFKIENFTGQQKNNLLPINFDKSKKNIAIFNSTIDEFSSIDGWENVIYDGDDNNAIDKILYEFKNIDNIHFYLRVHPNLKNVSSETTQIMDLKKIELKYNNITIIWPEEPLNSYTLLDACDIILVFSSTIGIEAAYWGKPVVLASRAFYESLDCIYKPKSHSELIALLKSELKPIASQSALKYAYREITNGISYKYFEEKGISNNNLPYGTFNGKKIQPNLFFRSIQFLRNIKYKYLN